MKDRLCLPQCFAVACTAPSLAENMDAAAAAWRGLRANCTPKCRSCPSRPTKLAPVVASRPSIRGWDPSVMSLLLAILRMEADARQYTLIPRSTATAASLDVAVCNVVSSAC